jgi:hypothetical protein
MFTLPRIAACLAAATLTIGAVTFMPALAASEKQAAQFPPRAAFSQTLGSKQAVGFFEEQDGRCKVTLMVAEAFDEVNGRMPGSAARITATIEPSQSTIVESAEAQSLKVICGADARTVSIETTVSSVM